MWYIKLKTKGGIVMKRILFFLTAILFLSAIHISAQQKVSDNLILLAPEIYDPVIIISEPDYEIIYIEIDNDVKYVDISNEYQIYAPEGDYLSPKYYIVNSEGITVQVSEEEFYSYRNN